MKFLKKFIETGIDSCLMQRFLVDVCVSAYFEDGACNI